MTNIEKLQEIKEIIEELSLCHQKQILIILNDEPSVLLSENNNGVFINLSDLDERILEKLQDYIKYVNKQQLQLLSMEAKKDNIKNSFFTVANKKNIQKKKDKESVSIIVNGK